MIKKLQLFLDLDGVFANFDKGVLKLTGRRPHELSRGHLWGSITKSRNFFIDLEQIEGSEKLWEFCLTIDPSPIFLTGAPPSQALRDQKVEWVKHKFGPEHKTIVLPKKEKQLHAKVGHVLVDDTPINIDQWIAKEGHGVLHESCYKTTIEKIQLLSEAS
jgi:hypothetical protein